MVFKGSLGLITKEEGKTLKISQADFVYLIQELTSNSFLFRPMYARIERPSAQPVNQIENWQTDLRFILLLLKQFTVSLKNNLKTTLSRHLI